RPAPPSPRRAEKPRLCITPEILLLAAEGPAAALSPLCGQVQGRSPARLSIRAVPPDLPGQGERLLLSIGDSLLWVSAAFPDGQPGPPGLPVGGQSGRLFPLSG